MIKADITRKSGRIIRVALKDHAEDASGEYNLVCAAVSSVFITLVNGLEEVVKADVNADIGYGNSLVEINEDDALKLEKADVLLETFELAMRSMAEEYPGHINLKITEE